MASVNCLRSLVRPAAIPRAASAASAAAAAAPRVHPIMVSAAAPFSTTSAASAVAPPAVKSRRDLPKGQKKVFKRKTNIVPVKKPNPGERKAFRKRIQLSNNSALAVAGLETLSAETMLRDESTGKMVAIPDKLVDQLRALEAFKTTQTWNLFRQPHFLLRKETTEFIKKLADSSEKKEALRCVVTGSKLSGKSLLMLQAMSYALLNNWVVLHIPEGQELTNGNTEYSVVPDTEPVQFTQPVYCLKLLQSIYKANKAQLEKLKVEKDTSRLTGLKADATLADLVLNAKESDAAPATLAALWTELTLPGRPPVLFALDGLSHINKMSDYRDPAFNLVHAHELTLVRLFIDALSGKTALPNGGAILAITSESNSSRPVSQELVLNQLQAGQAGKYIPKPNPWEKNYDDRVYDALKNSFVYRLEGISKEEARSLIEYWAASGMLRSVISSRLVAEKWTLAGHGIVGELERASLQTMRM